MDILELKSTDRALPVEAELVVPEIIRRMALHHFQDLDRTELSPIMHSRPTRDDDIERDRYTSRSLLQRERVPRDGKDFDNCEGRAIAHTGAVASKEISLAAIQGTMRSYSRPAEIGLCIQVVALATDGREPSLGQFRDKAYQHTKQILLGAFQYYRQLKASGFDYQTMQRDHDCIVRQVISEVAYFSNSDSLNCHEKDA